MDRLDPDDFPFNDHFLLFRGLQAARIGRSFPEFLDGVHDIGLLLKECVTHLLGPVQLLAHH